MARTSTLGAAAGGRVGCAARRVAGEGFAEWGKRGGVERLQELLLDELGAAGRIDRDRFSVDSFRLRAVKGDLTGANPTDWGKAGSKLHVAGERCGLPVSVVLSAANANDNDATGRRRPGKIEADKTDDHPVAVPTSDGEASVRGSPDAASSPRRGGPLPLDDRAHRRLAGRVAAAAHPYERCSERFYALVLLACSVICFHTLRPPR